MVLDPVTALALAGNVLQFLQMGSQFAVRATTICLSKSNGLSELQELRQLTVDLQRSLQQLQKPSQGHQTSSGMTTTASETRLASLSEGCSKLAQELVTKLDKIGINDTGGRMGTILKGFRAYFNASRIDELNTRINSYRFELATALVVSMRSHVTLSLNKQDEILHELSLVREQMTGQRMGFEEVCQRGTSAFPGNVIMDYLSGFLKPDADYRIIDSLHQTINSVISDPFRDYKDWDDVIGKNYPDFHLHPEKESDLQAQLINDLHFGEIAYRESIISEAYQGTFKWIFEESDSMRTGFTTWLRSDSNLYWITGKAGSGKSTLMKFIGTYGSHTSRQKSMCREYLEDWADGRSLVVASFYFWASGRPVEASQQGLLRTLLYQLLRQRPDIIPMVAPQLWETACLFGFSNQDWSNTDRTVAKLRRMLNSAIRTLTTSCSSGVCLFVDGLDEFDGDPKELLSQFRELTDIPNVKLCVASRPWLVFEDAFNKKPALMLQNLTSPDIRNFVVSEFSNDEGFKRLQVREPRYSSELMVKITDKASGVFLWVKLVVKSLLAGLAYDDRISDLQRRLDALPADLENLYAALLNTLEPFYFEHASQYFKFMMAARDPPSALVFSFADEDDPEFALKQPVEALAQGQVAVRITTIRRRLNSRCKGLLELGPDNRVQFLHRSVKDYLQNYDIQCRLEEASSGYDAYLKYCAAYLSVLKSIIPGNSKSIITENSEFDLMKRYVRLCLMAAADVCIDRPLMIRLLDALEEVLMNHLNLTNVETIYEMVPDNSRLEPYFKRSFGTSFLSLTVRFGIVAYVSARAPDGCMTQQFDPYSTTSMAPRTNNSKESNCSSPSLQPRQRFKPILNPLQRGSTRGRRLGDLLGWKSSSSKKLHSAARTQPLLLDAILGHPLRVDMFQCLFDHGADCNVVLESVEGGMSTPWQNALAEMLTARYDEWFKWARIVRLFVDNGAEVNRGTVANLPLIRMGNMDGERAYEALKSALGATKNYIGR